MGKKYSLFYEYCRGYTIYSIEQGKCCLHGKRGGCLHIHGDYACFPDIEEAEKMIKYSQTNGRSSWVSMERDVPKEVYVCLNFQG